jgi:hypothetical protein
MSGDGDRGKIIQDLFDGARGHLEEGDIKDHQRYVELLDVIKEIANPLQRRSIRHSPTLQCWISCP